MLCHIGFVDDCLFSHNGANWPESNTTHMFCRLRQMAAPMGVKSLSTIAGLFLHFKKTGFYVFSLEMFLFFLKMDYLCSIISH